MVKPKIVLLIFVSGKVVLTGAKVRQEIYEAFDNIYPILKNFKKQWSSDHVTSVIICNVTNVQKWSEPLLICDHCLITCINMRALFCEYSVYVIIKGLKYISYTIA